MLGRRKFVGVNVGSEEPCWHNRYSASVVDVEKNLIYWEVLKNIPTKLSPSNTETKDDVIDKLSKCRFLDILWSQFPTKPECPLKSTDKLASI